MTTEETWYDELFPTLMPHINCAPNLQIQGLPTSSLSSTVIGGQSVAAHSRESHWEQSQDQDVQTEYTNKETKGSCPNSTTRHCRMHPDGDDEQIPGPNELHVSGDGQAISHLQPTGPSEVLAIVGEEDITSWLRRRLILTSHSGHRRMLGRSGLRLSLPHSHLPETNPGRGILSQPPSLRDDCRAHLCEA